MPSWAKGLVIKAQSLEQGWTRPVGQRAAGLGRPVDWSEFIPDDMGGKEIQEVHSFFISSPNGWITIGLDSPTIVNRDMIIFINLYAARTID